MRMASEGEASVTDDPRYSLHRILLLAIASATCLTVAAVQYWNAWRLLPTSPRWFWMALGGLASLFLVYGLLIGRAAWMRWHEARR